MGKRDNKNQALGDDPLAWLSAGTGAVKKPKKKPVSSENKVQKKLKKKPEPEKQAAKKKPVPDEVKSKASNRLVLESSLVINNASDFHQSLKDLAASGQTIEIDASKVEIIDTAILQLLFAFALDLKEKNVPISWHKPTESLLNKASILGLSENLGL